MDAEHLQALAARDQLWSSLRALMPEIEELSAGAWKDSDRQRQLIQVLARIVVEEMKFRATDSKPE